jgi:outer membrane protein OmpA-like peptidoglycan-associated protein
VVEIEAKYELLRRGQYVVNVMPSDLTPMKMEKKTPLDLYEARNAVRIAQWAGASVYATESFKKASVLLDRAEEYKNRKSGTKQIAMTAREAVQTAEDARLIALQRQEEERLANERRAAAEREAQANTAAAGARADADAADRDRARAEADSAAARTQVERARMDAELAALRVEREKAEALAASERARLAAAEQSESARKAALEQSEMARKTAAEQAELARQTAVERAEREKQELRNKLAEQLNLILVTRDSARGLIVEMSDVLFDTDKYTLRSGAREKLAKISGIVLAYPGLKLEVEGHTDSNGSDEYNMRLSENRAGSVRDFLVLQGIDASSISTRGFGESRPVTTNVTAAGRQGNRRVEMVVSGDAIGKTASLTSR